MADPQDILVGSYKGIQIVIRNSGVAGGVKSVVSQFPNRDTQSVQVLGKIPRRFNFDILVREQINESYSNYRNRLLAALETGTEGDLIHPWYGRIANVIATRYDIQENFSSYGKSTLSVEFEVNNNIGIPETSGNVTTEVGVLNDNVQSAAIDDISENYKVTSAFAGNFEAAVDKVNDIIDKANEATDFVGASADAVNSFQATINNLSSNINSLVNDPKSLADGIVGLVESVSALYTTAEATLDALRSFFGFGADDVEINPTTAGKIERKKNTDTLNGVINATCLGWVYISALESDFSSTDEIDDLTNELNTQYELIQDSGVGQDVKNAIRDQRLVFLDAIRDIRLNTSQIVTIWTSETTARLLAYQYYGNDQRYQDIIDLNSFEDPQFISGYVKVLTI